MNITQRTARIFLVNLIILWSCSAVLIPDLARLYQFDPDAFGVADAAPLIVIHGAFGSRWVNVDGEQIWVEELNRVLGSDYQDLTYLIDHQNPVPLEH
jgi:hypothetical protein